MPVREPEAILRSRKADLYCEVSQRGEIRQYDGDGYGTAACDTGAYEALSITEQFPWQIFIPAILAEAIKARIND